MLKDDEKDILKKLREIQKCRDKWKDNMDYVGVKLKNDSPEIKAKALWLLGEMGLKYPFKAEHYLEDIAGYLEDDNPKLRERSLNALGRIGRGDYKLIVPYMDRLMKMRYDDAGAVRLSFVWACENIATEAPWLFCEKLDIFFEMIEDSYEKVRIEAPEMFRVVGKRMPKCVKPYLEGLKWHSQNNEHPVVRIHCTGAIRITEKADGKS